MKVGEYLRTDDGLIMKIEKIERNAITTDISLNDYSSNLINRKYLEEIIIKSSPNIIDLIEVGDYANGYKVIDVSDYVTVDLLLCDGNSYRHREFSDNEIKSILTKEQFESMKYRIGE